MAFSQVKSVQVNYSGISIFNNFVFFCRSTRIKVMEELQLIIIILASASLTFILFISILYVYRRSSVKNYNDDEDEEGEASRSDKNTSTFPDNKPSWWNVSIKKHSGIR